MHDHYKSASLVLFYAPWSSHSKKLLPVWEEAAAQAKELYLDVQLAKVDASKSKDVMQDVGAQVVSYPTIKLIRDGSLHDVEKHGRDLRTPEKIVEEVRRQAAYKRPEQLITAQDAKDFVKNEKCAIIGFLVMPIAIKPEFKTFNEAAFELAGRCSFAFTAVDFDEYDKKAKRMRKKSYVDNKIGAALDFPVAEYPGLALITRGYVRQRKVHFALHSDESEDKQGEQLDQIVEWFHANEKGGAYVKDLSEL